MNKKGSVSIIIAAIVLAAIAAAGAYFILSGGKDETAEEDTLLSQELLSLAIVREFISDNSGSIDQNLLPFKSDNYQLDLHLVTPTGEWSKYKSSYFINGVPEFSGSAVDYPPDKKHALQFPTNEHGGANLWDLENQFVYQLCSHCGIEGSYWINDSKFILLNLISSGQSDDGMYHKAIQLFDLANKTISVSISAGITDYEPLASNGEPDKPVIESITPQGGPVGTVIELHGKNFNGFEGDLDAWIENSSGKRGIVHAINKYTTPETSTLIRFKLEARICTINTSYSGLDCPEYLDIVPGTYKVYTEPWGNRSNIVQFTVTATK